MQKKKHLLPIAILAATALAPTAHAGWFSASPIPEPTGNIPFTTFEFEKNYMLKNLPCKWVSMGGKDGAFRYDVMCKGGNWATVSLLLDKAPNDANGVGRVRLLYRDWSEAAHPGGGEAYVAQQFLQYTLDHFVPANLSAKVGPAFWGTSGKNWQTPTLAMSYTAEKQNYYTLHRLEIAGLKAPAGTSSTPPEAGQQAEKPKLKPLKTTELTIEWKGAPITPALPPAKRVSTTPPAQPQATAAPTSPTVLSVPATGGLSLPPTKALPETKQLPTPQGLPKGGSWLQSKLPADAPVATPVPLVPATPQLATPTLPDVVVASTTLQVAHPADVTTQPEPESLQKPAPVTLPSSTLVPAEASGLVRGKAPSNFDVYNKAEELTRAIEEKAKVNPSQEVKVTPSQGQSGLAKNASLPVSPVSRTAPVPEIPASAPDISQSARPLESTRPLPQLKFIPKAKPLEEKDSILKFEDEKSKI